MSELCKAIGLVCEHLENPLGIDCVTPRLSWRLADERPGARQTAYRIVAASSLQKLTEKPDLWDSGEVESSATLDIPYGGKRLRSRSQVWWQVQVRDHRGKPGGWSEPACFEVGLLRKTDWQASWIGRPADRKTGSGPSPWLRREFRLDGEVRQARLHVTALGIYEMYLNGQRVGDEVFAPGWTDYAKRLQVSTHDVTGLLRSGDNAIGGVLADGWYAGNLIWNGNRCSYGNQLGLLAQLEVEYADGRRETIGTDGDWVTAEGPILEADFYNGETYDARRELTGWDKPGYDAAGWAAAAVLKAPRTRLVARQNGPVRRQLELPAIARTEPQPGVYIFDLGQNMVGWARLKLKGRRGQTVRLRYGEMLCDDGTLYTANLRTAKTTDYYTFKGAGEVEYEPRFTFHGFRYVEISGGLTSQPVVEDVTGIVLHSDLGSLGRFECSEPLVNQLQSNINWSLRGNFLEVPTDCPQRDERLGWTGDAQVFVGTACYNRDAAAFFKKWGLDLIDAQMPDGGVPHVVPDVIRNGGVSAAWADAAVICPWVAYQHYGDLGILEQQYDSMAAWVAWQERNSHDYHLPEVGYYFGDWLAIDIPMGDCGRAPTPKDLIGTAYFAHCADIMSQTAAALGRKEDERRYKAMVRKVRAAFQREFVAPSGRVVGDTQTGYLLALAFDLLPERQRAYAVERLVKDIEGRGWKLSTGFVGTPLLAPVLTRFGRVDVAYRLLLQQDYPSWIYSILQGATTMWERWNSYTKKNGFGDVGMNSFNHYAYGAIGEWLYATVAGIAIDPAAPGFEKIILQPTPGAGLTSAEAEVHSRHGTIFCGWKIRRGELLVEAVVPPNTSASLRLPGQPAHRLAAGRHSFAFPWPAGGAK